MSEIKKLMAAHHEKLLLETAECRKRTKELERENAALRADKERLDWLDHYAIPWTWMSPEKIDGLGPIVVTWKSNRTLRAAIDLSIKEIGQ